MPLTIAIASGKGGTGKTTVAVGLSQFLSQKAEVSVQLADCDVEEPNDHLFFPDLQKELSGEVYKKVPVISKEHCTYCRKCVEYCEFNAIVVIPPAKYAEVNRDLCHSCGACLVACADDAITEVDEPIGHINKYNSTRNDMVLTEGRLRIGSTMQTMLIRETKKQLSTTEGFLLLDAPPGTSCPVVETVNGAAYVIVVAEPTPFGLHDMKLMTVLLEELNIPFGIVINKAGIGDNAIYEYIREKELTLITEIPFSKTFAKAYASANLEAIPVKITRAFEQLIAFIENHNIRRS